MAVRACCGWSRAERQVCNCTMLKLVAHALHHYAGLQCWLWVSILDLPGECSTMWPAPEHQAAMPVPSPAAPRITGWVGRSLRNQFQKDQMGALLKWMQQCMEVKWYFGTASWNIFNSNEGWRSALEMAAHLLLPHFYFKAKILELPFSVPSESCSAPWNTGSVIARVGPARAVWELLETMGFTFGSLVTECAVPCKDVAAVWSHSCLCFTGSCAELQEGK